MDETLSGSQWVGCFLKKTWAKTRGATRAVAGSMRVRVGSAQKCQSDVAMDQSVSAMSLWILLAKGYNLCWQSDRVNCVFASNPIFVALWRLGAGRDGAIAALVDEELPVVSSCTVN